MSDLTDRTDERVEDYLAGRMTEAEREAFEREYFESDDTWSELERALEIRAAFQAPAATVRGSRPRSFARWVPLAAAAGLVLAVGLVWLWQSTMPGLSPPPVRGSGWTFDVAVEASEGALHVQWPALDGAEAYLVQLYDGAGDLVVEQETDELTLTLPLPVGREVVRVRVRALDHLRQQIAASEPAMVEIPRP